MLCPNCKQEIDNNSAFCEYCGTRIKKNKKGLWITLGIVAVAIVIGTIAIVSFKQQSDDYVDLGLPSGTLWSSTNAGGNAAYYTYDEAINLFGDKLPTQVQFEELINGCMWYWEDGGFKIVGPNGNDIYMPAMGFRYNDGDYYYVGTNGTYLSSTIDTVDYVSVLIYNSHLANMGVDKRGECGFSVRLVYNP